jgi:hypothetical protein
VAVFGIHALRSSSPPTAGHVRPARRLRYPSSRAASFPVCVGFGPVGPALGGRSRTHERFGSVPIRSTRRTREPTRRAPGSNRFPRSVSGRERPPNAVGTRATVVAGSEATAAFGATVDGTTIPVSVPLDCRCGSRSGPGAGYPGADVAVQAVNGPFWAVFCSGSVDPRSPAVYSIPLYRIARGEVETTVGLAGL